MEGQKMSKSGKRKQKTEETEGSVWTFGAGEKQEQGREPVIETRGRQARKLVFRFDGEGIDWNEINRDYSRRGL
jgi:hypothetical protein